MSYDPEWDEIDRIVAGEPPRLAALERAQQVAVEYRAIVAFVEWVRSNGMDIGLVPVIPGSLLIPVPDSPEKLAASFYDINFDQLSADRAEYIYRQEQEEK